MKKLVLVLIFLISISFISGLCEEGQIDINTASKTELEELYLVGPVKAQAIIDSRPFNSVEEILHIYGIGEKTLQGIKEQGLACVDVEEDEVEKEEPEKIIEEIVDEVIEEQEDKQIEEEEEEENEIITLTAKTIKSQDNKNNKSNYAIYGFVAFCVLLGILFIIKNKKYKNEFR
jgi:competence ComEA-like helix-hairpin-helix protein